VVDREIEKIAAKYADALIKKGLHIQKMILFGSYACDRAHPESDIDIAVVSSDFGKDRFEEGKMLLQAAWRVDPRIEPVPVSSDAYENDTWIPLIYEIRQKGIELKAA